MPMIRSDAVCRRPARRHAVWLLAVFSLAGCASVGESIPGIGRLVSPYQIDVQQGNVITREQTQALRIGMLREQVRDILGSPLLTSVFHANRWDYAFSFKRQGQPPQQRRLVVFFQGGQLARVESDDLPTEAELVASLDARRSTTESPPLQATEEQLKKFAARHAPAKPSSGAPSADGAASMAYPPLEPAGAAR